MKQYIKQKDSTNFIYPNNDLSEYDVEIVHEINNLSVSGTVESFQFSQGAPPTETEIVGRLEYTWSLNGAEPFINDEDELVMLSVHALPAETLYYKPWRVCEYYVTGTTTLTAYTSPIVYFAMHPEDYGLDKFYNGDYHFEFRFIGHRSVYTLSSTLPVTGLTSPDTIVLTGVTASSSNILALGFSGATNCDDIQPQYSRDGVSWNNGDIQTDCTSPASLYISDNTGVWYVRLLNYTTLGTTAYSNALTFSYDPVLYDVTMSSGANFTLEFSGVTDCSSMSGQYSRNQITWTTGTPTSCTSPLVIQTTSADGTWYFRLKQNVNPTGTRYSNILSYTY